MPRGSNLTSQGEARGRVHRLWQSVHELLHSDKVLRVATVQVFEMDAGGVGVLLTSQTLVKRQRERVGPCHFYLRGRLRGGRWRWAFYSASPGVSLAERRSW